MTVRWSWRPQAKRRGAAFTGASVLCHRSNNYMFAFCSDETVSQQCQRLAGFVSVDSVTNHRAVWRCSYPHILLIRSSSYGSMPLGDVPIQRWIRAPTINSQQTTALWNSAVLYFKTQAFPWRWCRQKHWLCLVSSAHKEHTVLWANIWAERLIQNLFKAIGFCRASSTRP